MALDFTSINLTPATGAVSVFTLKTRLKANLWTVPRSSDGTTYNATADQITTGSSGAGGMANNSAWFVIRMPSQGGVTREFCLQRGTTNLAWRVKYSYSAGFTGGSPGATQTPSATDEQILLGGGTDAAPTYEDWFGADGSYYLQVCVGSASEGYVFYTLGYPTAGGNHTHGFALDKVLQFYPSADVEPYVIVTAASASNPFDNGNIAVVSGTGTARAWHKKGLGGEGFVKVAAQRYADASGNVAVPVSSNVNPYNSKHDLVPILWARRSAEADPDGHKGWSRLFCWASVTGPTSGDSYTWGSGSKNSIVANIGVVLPFKGDGTAPSKNAGSTNYSAQSFVPWPAGSILTVNPADGAPLGADYLVASQQAVTVTMREIPDGAKFIVYVRFKDSALLWVVYESDLGFAPAFNKTSTLVGNVLTVLPDGGWHREPDRFWVGFGVEART